MQPLGLLWGAPPTTPLSTQAQEATTTMAKELSPEEQLAANALKTAGAHHANSFKAKHPDADKKTFQAFVAKLQASINPDAFARVKPELDEALSQF
jgi:hypothetical protein